MAAPDNEWCSNKKITENFEIAVAETALRSAVSFISGKMKTAAGKTSEETRAVAHALDKGNGLAKPAPEIIGGGVIQRKLKVNQTYEALKDQSAYDDLDTNGPKQVLTGQLYTAMQHATGMYKQRTQLYDRTNNEYIFIKTQKNDAIDALNFKALGPDLAQSDRQGINQHPDSITFKDYFKENNPVPDITHVSQGNIGDCWLLGVMAAVVRSPKWNAELFSRLAIDKVKREYVIKLAEGVPDANTMKLPDENIVRVSGYLAQYINMGTGKSELLYAQQLLGIPDAMDANPDTAAVWPAILEKAVAQYYGGYQKLDNKLPDKAFGLLTGTASKKVLGKNVTNETWGELKTAFDTEGAITMTTRKNKDVTGTKLSVDGNDAVKINAAYKKLIEDHVYTVVGMTDAEITLRNPHGQHHPDKIVLADFGTHIHRVDWLPGN